MPAAPDDSASRQGMAVLKLGCSGRQNEPGNKPQSGGKRFWSQRAALLF